MKVVVFPVGGEPYIKEIENKLCAMQTEVGGYIEPVYISDDPVCLIVNEEGILLGLPYNRGQFFGDIFFVGTDGENFCSVPEELMDKYIHFFDT